VMMMMKKKKGGREGEREGRGGEGREEWWNIRDVTHVSEPVKYLKIQYSRSSD
jgi:hypothetical protein